MGYHIHKPIYQINLYLKIETASLCTNCTVEHMLSVQGGVENPVLLCVTSQSELLQRFSLDSKQHLWICPESTSYDAVSYLDDQYQSGKSASRFDAKVSTEWWYKNSHDTDNDVFFAWCVYKSALSFFLLCFWTISSQIFSDWWTWWPRWWTNQCQLSIGFWTQTKRCQRFFVLLSDCLIFVLFCAFTNQVCQGPNNANNPYVWLKIEAIGTFQVASFFLLSESFGHQTLTGARKR